MIHPTYSTPLWIRAAVRLVFLVSIGLITMAWLTAATTDASSLDSEQGLAELYSKLRGGSVGEEPMDAEPPAQPTVYLTFDDGPSGLTPQVLDLLAEEGIPATFFVLGQMAEQYPETIARIVDEGHSLGNHSYNHVYKDLYRDFDHFWEQTVTTEQILEELTGKRPTLLRAPGGTYTNFDAFYFYYLKEAGYRIVDWNVDSGDSKRRGVPASEIIATVKQSPLRHELTVLLHDGQGHQETVKALPDIIKFYKDKGYSFAALEEKEDPVQFKVGPLKWQRNTRYDQFVQQTMKVRKHHQEYANMEFPQEENAEERSIPLQISWDGEPWTLNPGQYQFEKGRFTVPLQKLADAWGAELEWSGPGGEEGTVILRSGMREAEIDPTHGVIHWSFFGESGTYHMADVQWVDGEIYVGLRMMAELFHYRITDYSLEPDERTVQIESEKGLWLPWERTPASALSKSKP
ncbi:polysaccharide deacetylase family protein [Paenibacillus sp. J2TS4]|uniref:polysaccharide deacetylase family protein n=1 Tax=Paenibacillus sp. J2TS4 TaxID=2807194 RepID=UPI001B233D3E|nr:polysaccharide deacetylase family protein [Paenibacillus sp. J2TS4]GIP34600.1 hypothetical protein J2TS4_38100 [Paenibacillus sp. J2TS4]